MGDVKRYAAELFDAGDGNLDADALQEAQEKWELEKLQNKYGEKSNG